MLQRLSDHCVHEGMKTTTGVVGTALWFVLLIVIYPLAWVEHLIAPISYDDE